jgi:hypothetical protein
MGFMKDIFEIMFYKKFNLCLGDCFLLSSSSFERHASIFELLTY